MQTYEEIQRAFRETARSRPAEARRLLARYAARARRDLDSARRAEAQLMRGDLESILGRPSSAAPLYAEARRTFARRGMPSKAFAADLGAVQALGQLGRKRRLLAAAARIRRAEVPALHRAYGEIAVASALGALSEDRASEGGYRAALALLRPLRDPRAAGARATARLSLGVRLARRGATVEAVALLKRARTFFEGAGQPVLAAVALHDLGWAEAAAGRAGEGLKLFAEAKRAFLAHGDRRRSALVRLDEAELFLRLGDSAAATAARAAARELERLGALPEAAGALLVSARAELLRSRAAAARRAAERARDLARGAGDRVREVGAGILLSQHLARAEAELFRRGHYLGALEALLAYARSLAPAKGAALLTRRARAYPAVLRAWVAPELGRLQARADPPRRIPHLRRAVRAAEVLRERGPTAALKTSLLALNLSCFEELARALLKRGRKRDLREAFSVLDAARSRTLREEVESEAPALFASPRLRQVRERLEALWSALDRRDRTGSDLRGAETRLLSEVRAAERRLAAGLRSERTAGKKAASSNRLPASPCLAYSVLGGQVHGFLAGPSAIETWSCGSLRTLRRDLERFRFEVVRRLHGPCDARPALDLLERLGARLLPARLPQGGRLAVACSLELLPVPFESLFFGGKPLLERCAVYQVPAALEVAEEPGGRGELLVGVAEEALPEVRREIAALRRRFPRARVLTGAAATREATLSHLAGRRLIHLAGHARAREDLAPLTAFRLAGGWIAAGDLGGRRLKGALVVLSGCRTGDPALRWNGEGLGGFPRALLAAGASAVVASRWQVADATAREWMEYFYEDNDGRRPEQACARASARMRARSPHPADWAAFLVIRGGCIPEVET